MKRSGFAVAAFAATMAAAAAAWSAPKFEAQVIPATTQFPVGFFRVEIATGKVFQQWGGATSFSPTVDSAPLPAGEYHIFATSYTAPDGKVTWSLQRMDAVSGRAWVAIGGGDKPLAWNEIVTPK